MKYRDDIIRLLKQGMSHRDIAKTLGCARGTVSQVVSNRSYLRRKNKTPSLEIANFDIIWAEAKKSCKIKQLEKNT